MALLGIIALWIAPFVILASPFCRLSNTLARNEAKRAAEMRKRTGEPEPRPEPPLLDELVPKTWSDLRLTSIIVFTPAAVGFLIAGIAALFGVH